MSIGERIHELRKSKGISQGQLAEMLGISRQAVSKWENDLASPDTLNLIKLADVLDTEVEYIATGRSSAFVKESAPIVVNLVSKEDRIIEKPIIKHLVRIKYLRNPVEFALVGIVCFILGIILGLFF